jgi:transposase InsO family protein
MRPGQRLLVNELYDVHRNLDDTYGSPRMTDELGRRGYCVNHKRTERLMAQNGIYAKDGRRKKVRTTIPDITAPPLEDLVKRDFRVGEPGLRACDDRLNPSRRGLALSRERAGSRIAAPHRLLHGFAHADRARGIRDGDGDRSERRRRLRHDLPPRPRQPIHVSGVPEAL